MFETYFMTAAAIAMIFAAVHWSSFGRSNQLLKTALFGLSFWGGVEALVSWGFLHSPL